MSASNEWTEWHLTPRGWEMGSARVDFAGITDVPRPADAVLTERYSEVLSSMYGKMDRDVSRVWSCEDAERIRTLFRQHGPCPRKL